LPALRLVELLHEFEHGLRGHDLRRIVRHEVRDAGHVIGVWLRDEDGQQRLPERFELAAERPALVSVSVASTATTAFRVSTRYAFTKMPPSPHAWTWTVTSGPSSYLFVTCILTA
jgi:hypothetical protein